MEEWKRSGQIPAFGDWDRANELPITQYFESARQAGLLRHSSSSGECGHHYIRGNGAGGDLYSVDFQRPRNNYNNNNDLAAPRKARLRDKGVVPHHVKEQKKQGDNTATAKVCVYVTDLPRKKQQQQQQQQEYNHAQKQYRTKSKNDDVLLYGHQKGTAAARSKLRTASRPPKAVDEDLYKIPPKLLRSSKRKKMPGFFSCLVPPCAT